MAIQLQAAATRLLDFSQPTDTELLDKTIEVFYESPSAEERKIAEEVLKKLQEAPDAWTRVDGILAQSKSAQSKYFALQILEGSIKYRWCSLSNTQREGIKNFVTNLIIKLSSDGDTFRKERTFLNKLNMSLVQILKQEWPQNWNSFIPDITAASKTNETLCENSMTILKLLSEEIFDFSLGELTQAKTQSLKESLNTEFRLIHELCLFVLSVSQKPELTRATLDTLVVYLSWVPLGYILESNIVDYLLKLLIQPAFRNLAIQCLTEVAGLSGGPEYDDKYLTMYNIFMQQLQVILVPSTDIAQAYEGGNNEDQEFVQNLALFFTSFFRVHLPLLEKNDKTFLLLGLEYLVKISFVPGDEVFKITLDYWNFFVPNIWSSVQITPPVLESVRVSSIQTVDNARKNFFAGILSKLRLLMITRMAKPEEVIVVEDENGNIVRETMKDTDTLARYKTMHETLVYLSHLDHEDTENQMLGKLNLQLNGKEWSWNSLNTLCWAMGSISGSMSEDQENRFLVTVIRDLLTLCEMTRGKDNKAVIASNIMYVVGQYPRFLRNHWKFLKTVVNKLFEFMHETHPGVQDMACETFLKICNKCRRKFVISQASETEPFICELLNLLTSIIHDLHQHQIHMFYEAVGLIIASDNDAGRRTMYLEQLMQPPNSSWRDIISMANVNLENLKDVDTIRAVLNLLQTNVSVCSSAGQYFTSQMSLIYTDALHFYKMYSELISSSIAGGEAHAARTSKVKLMRSCKKAVLKLIETFVEKSNDMNLLQQSIVPALMDPVLGDYSRNVPDARDAEVLSLFAKIINTLKTNMQTDVPRIFEAVFECTLQMITKNFEDYPEHRLQFFSLLRAITNECGATLFQMTTVQLKLVIDSIIWAFRHTERNVADTGLNLLLEMLQIFDKSQVATEFYQEYFLALVREIFAVMTDTFHKPGLKMHAKILYHLFEVLKSDNIIKRPLWDITSPDVGTYSSNQQFVNKQVSQLLIKSFPHMSAQQIEVVMQHIFDSKDLQAFKSHLRDFLVKTKEFASQDNTAFYADEQAQQTEAVRQKMAMIPGMMNPHDELLTEQMTDD